MRAAVVALVLDDPSDWTSTRHATQRVHLCAVYQGVGNGDADLALTVCVEVPPTEPACAEGWEHDYVSPHGLFGGLAENPGVVGKGGGIVCSEACCHCGVVRTTDTWATDPYDGSEGHTIVTYCGADEARGADAVGYFRSLGERRAARIDPDDGKADLSTEGALYREGFVGALRRRLAADGRPSDVHVDPDGVAWWILPE